jgi:hypothetical protein
MIKKTKPIIIISIVIATVLVSSIACGTLSFAASTGNSTGEQHISTVESLSKRQQSSNTTLAGPETVFVSLCGVAGPPKDCKHNPQKPLPTSGIPVVASCKWDPPNDKKTCFGISKPYGYSLKDNIERFDIEHIHPGSYEISVHPIPAGVNPTYIGHCHSHAITPGKTVTCIIDPYGG